MEGAGLCAATGRIGTAWILVKGICDWADGEKDSRHQRLAAAAATSLVLHVLSRRFALRDLTKPQPPAVAPKELPSHVKKKPPTIKDGQEKRRILEEAIEEGASIGSDTHSSEFLSGSLLPVIMGQEQPSLEGLRKRYDRWCNTTAEKLQESFGSAEKLEFEQRPPIENDIGEYGKLRIEIDAKVTTLKAILYSLGNP